MIIFGGFHESLRAETRFFNDTHIFDFKTLTWTEFKYSKLARLPPPRSACNLAITTAPTEALFVYGGYSKVKNANAQGSKSEGIIHIDCWMLPLKSLVAGLNAGQSPPSWERQSRKGEYPSSRAGSSSIMHKNKMLVFGGVLDNEGDHHKMDSIFYDDLFSFDMEKRRWFALRLKRAADGKGRRRRKKKDDASNNTDQVGDDDSGNSDSDEGEADMEAISSGWDLDKLRHDMFAFIDGDGNIVYEKIEDDDDAPDTKVPQVDKSELITKDTTEREPVRATNSGANPSHGDTVNQKDSAERISFSDKGSKRIQPTAVMKVDSKGIPTSVVRETPLPRINCATVIKGNTLYIYGGMHYLFRELN